MKPVSFMVSSITMMMWVSTVENTSITLSAGLALLIGLLFRSWPVKKTADLHPIHAHRYESFFKKEILLKITTQFK